MAQLSHHAYPWVGHGFDPGVEHYWVWEGRSFSDVVHVMAHAVQLTPRQLMVKDVRTHVDVAGNRSISFTIRNTGVNNIAGYSMCFAVVRP